MVIPVLSSGENVPEVLLRVGHALPVPSTNNALQTHLLHVRQTSLPPSAYLEEQLKHQHLRGALG